MEIDLPTTKPIVLTPGEENMLIPESEGDFIITLTSDRGTPTATFTEDDTPKAQGTSLFNREFKLHIKTQAILVVKETVADTVITLSVAEAPESKYGTAAVTPGVAHQVNFVPDSNKPETQSAVIYFGESVQASVQEVFVHDGDVVIPAHATAHVPVGHSITITPLVEQTKAVAQA